ncbi:MAG: glycosyltransferase family 4 protein [Planctomycetota bacterium]
MDIAFIAKRYDTVGGTERDLYELSGCLSRFGHSVHVYCQEVRTQIHKGVSIHKVPSPGLGRTARLWSLAYFGPRIAFKGGHDLVVGFTRLLHQDVVRCGGGTHRVFLQRMMETEGALKRFFKRISPYHTSMLSIEKRQFGKDGYRKVVAISEVVKKELLDVYGVPGEDIDIIYDGIDTELFNPDKRSLYREAVRSEFGLPRNAPVCLFLGNGFKRKGLDMLLKSLASLKGEGLYCLVVGGDAAIDRYKGKAKFLKIDDRVIFTGPRKDAVRFYAAADFYVLPSLQEAFGNAALEAMACGIPVIVSGRAGASELLKGELERYILNNPHDADEMAAVMMELLDPSKRIKLGQIARKTAERYSLEANARDIERLCLQVIKDKKNA